MNRSHCLVVAALLAAACGEPRTAEAPVSSSPPSAASVDAERVQAVPPVPTPPVQEALLPQGLDTLCAGIDRAYWYRCAPIVERHQLALSSESVWRSDSATLVVQLLSGDTVFFRDSSMMAEPNIVQHYYREYVPEVGFHLLELHFYEGHAFLLVNAVSGRRTLVPGLPVPAPGGARLVVTSVDLDAEYNPTVIQIWTAQPGPLRLEWEFNPLELQGGVPPQSRWGLSHPRWLHPDSIEVRTHYSGGRLGRVRHVVHTTDGWVLRKPDA